MPSRLCGKCLPEKSRPPAGAVAASSSSRAAPSYLDTARRSIISKDRVEVPARSKTPVSRPELKQRKDQQLATKKAPSTSSKRSAQRRSRPVVDSGNRNAVSSAPSFTPNYSVDDNDVIPDPATASDEASKDDAVANKGSEFENEEVARSEIVDEEIDETRAVDEEVEETRSVDEEVEETHSTDLTDEAPVPQESEAIMSALSVPLLLAPTATIAPSKTGREITTTQGSRCVACDRADAVYRQSSCKRCGGRTHESCQRFGICFKCVPRGQSRCDRPIHTGSKPVSFGPCAKCSKMTSARCDQCRAYYHTKCGLALGCCPSCSDLLLPGTTAPVAAASSSPLGTLVSPMTNVPQAVAPPSISVPTERISSSPLSALAPNDLRRCFACDEPAASQCKQCKRYVHHTCGFNSVVCFDCYDRATPQSYSSRKIGEPLDLFQLRQAATDISEALGNRDVKVLWPGSLQSRAVFRRAYDRLQVGNKDRVFVVTHSRNHFASFSFTGSAPASLAYRESLDKPPTTFSDESKLWKSFFDTTTEVSRRASVLKKDLIPSERENSCGWCVLNDFANFILSDHPSSKQVFCQSLLLDPMALRFSLTSLRSKERWRSARYVRGKDNLIQLGASDPDNPGFGPSLLRLQQTGREMEDFSDPTLQQLLKLSVLTLPSERAVKEAISDQQRRRHLYALESLLKTIRLNAKTPSWSRTDPIDLVMVKAIEALFKERKWRVGTARFAVANNLLGALKRIDQYSKLDPHPISKSIRLTGSHWTDAHKTWQKEAFRHIPSVSHVTWEEAEEMLANLFNGTAPAEVLATVRLVEPSKARNINRV